MNKEWWKKAVVYQIYPRSFNDSNGDGIGDLPGIREKIDYLEYLGIDLVWLNPVYDSPNDDNGYDVRNYRKIMDEFGDMGDWEALLEDLHERGIKLVMDFIPNHTSDEHRWFRKSRKSRDNKYRDYYFWRSGNEKEPPNNWDSVFGGSAWKFDDLTREYYLHLFSRKQPDLNWDNPEVRKELYEIMNWWLDKGIDGFRLDVVNFISKNPKLPDDTTRGPYGSRGSKYYVDGPNIHSYLQEMNRKVFAGRDAVAIGETPLVSVDEGAKYVEPSRNELDMIFQFDHVTFDLDDGGFWSHPKDWNLTELKDIFSRWRKVAARTGGWNATYLSNHDQPRMVSRLGDDANFRRESAKLLATLLLTISGTPFIYQGEELGMTNYPFSDISELRDVQTINQFNEMKKKGEVEDFEEVKDKVRFWSRDNARTPIQWTSGENAGFTKGEPWINVNPNKESINVEAEKKDENSVLNYYRDLISLRKDHEALIYGKYEPLMDDDEEIFAFKRRGKDETVLTVLNFSDGKRELSLSKLIPKGWRGLLLSNYPDENLDEERTNINLKPYEARLYLLE
ncbi:alpha-glucosidase [Candidatus Bipolaricaulota bacterium]|nr:alpha-glucosidase [Candidatus Bipolaricaulota bacterium]MBS3813851.1 alpha-glucosidase [Candidatus Bipolaricaulota bacterium]